MIQASFNKLKKAYENNKTHNLDEYFKKISDEDIKNSLLKY